MRSASIALIATSLAAAGAAAQPAELENAKVTVVAAEPGNLARQIRGLASGAPPRWIGWAVPAEDPESRTCCGSWGRNGTLCCGPCPLDRDSSTTTKNDGGGPSTARLEAPSELLLFARAAGGSVERVRHFSSECRVDAGGKTVLWLTGVRPEESVAWLDALAGARAGGHENSEETDLAEAALAGIAMHAGPAAERALAARIAPGQPDWMREKAAFWLAAARGPSGCATLVRAIPADADEGFREQGTFPLSLCEGGHGIETLIQMARRDASADVRAQALFWLAQKAGKKASEAIDGAIQNDPDTEVKKRAVFALTQMPDGEGVTQLIRIARINRNPEVREQAVFWLGQSRDPRALDFIEQILTP
ncbi:MAG TPA: HEAT repeat domain-containing protein [Thermoanaerobaculia bacterium]